MCCSAQDVHRSNRGDDDVEVIGARDTQVGCRACATIEVANEEEI